MADMVCATDLPPGGVVLDDDACDRRWDPWTPADTAARLRDCSAPWCVVGGWAIDLYLRRTTRVHDDTEIAVPRARFDELAGHFPDYAWDVVGAGRSWPYSDVADDPRLHQTWLRDPASGAYHLDVFREPSDGDRWRCRFAPNVTLPYDDLIATAPGTDSTPAIPYAVPEVVLFFKSRSPRRKDDADFAAVVPHLPDDRAARLHDWIAATSPDHRWLARLDR